jgi:hypothetical protein
MSQAASLETTQGFGAPSVTQFSVFLDNRVGKLYELLSTLHHSSAQLCALSVHEASDHAVVRIITNDATATRRVLREHRLAFTEMDLLVVELGKSHSLEQLCLYLLGAEISIRFAYPLMLRPNGTPTLALAVDDLTLAGQILRRKEFRIYGEADLPRKE